MRPLTDRTVRFDLLEFGRQLDPISVGIMDEDEEVIARPVTARSPFQGDMLLREMIGPIAYQRPLASFEAMMIEPVFRRQKQGEAVVIAAASKKRRPQSSGVVDNAVR